MSDTPISDEEAFTECVKEVVSLREQLQALRKAEIESLRARIEELELKVITYCMMRYAEADRCNAETERCAKIASDYPLSPVVGKAIAALIMHGGMEAVGAPVEPEEVYSPHTEVN